MLDSVMPVIGLVILCGSLGLSLVGWLRGRRMHRFRQAQRIERRRRGGGQDHNPRGRH